MKNTYGNSITLTLFGESHGEQIGVVIDGLTSGIKIDEDFMKQQLLLRKPQGELSTSRVEKDEPKIVSGVFNSYTTGSPICILFENENTKSKDYSETRYLARPGHADYTAYKKYEGYEDYRGGGHFSGRLTTPLVAAGSIFIMCLKQKGIKIGTHILKCKDIQDDSFSNFELEIEELNKKLFATISKDAEVKMKDLIKEAGLNGDSVGAILQTAVINLPAGLGEPFFDSIESNLSHLLFSIPGIKGVEFGLGFDMANYNGSFVNDSFRVVENKVISKTNNNGGINGGISNGMPILFNCVVKPTPSIYKKQETINFNDLTNQELEIKGRHDPAIFPRARVVIDSLVAFYLCDLLAQSYGTNYLR